MSCCRILIGRWEERCLEFLIINGNKLKISLSAEEIEKYTLSDDDKTSDEPGMRKSFWRILDIARDKCGFNASGEKVLIQFYKTSGGGEMFVTRLGKLTGTAEKTLAASPNVTMLSSQQVIYSFSEINNLIGAVKQLCPSSLEKCALYFCDNKLYYLVAEERVGRSKLSELSVLSEYGESVSPTLIQYIIEHSVKISENGALAALAQI